MIAVLGLKMQLPDYQKFSCLSYRRAYLLFNFHFFKKKINILTKNEPCFSQEQTCTVAVLLSAASCAVLPTKLQESLGFAPCQDSPSCCLRLRILALIREQVQLTASQGHYPEVIPWKAPTEGLLFFLDVSSKDEVVGMEQVLWPQALCHREAS